MPKKLYTKKHYNTSGQVHELTFSVYRRQDLFLDEKVCDIFLTELELARKEYTFQIWAYVIMPNLIHL
jgi:REP element-mobilizing transposase RayT